MTPSPNSRVIDPNQWFVSSTGIREKPVTGMPIIRERPVEGAQEVNVPLADRAIEFLRPILAPAAGVAVGTATSPFITPAGGIAAGMGASTAVDMAMQNALSQPPKDIPESLMNTGKMLLGNEVGGQALKYGSKLIPTSVKNAIIKKLEPTVGQATDNPVLKWIEDTFSIGGKKSAQANNLKLGQKEAEKIATSETGLTASELGDSHLLATNVKDNLQKLAGPYKSLYSKDSGLRTLIQSEENPIPAVEKILADPDKLQNALNARIINIPGIGVVASKNIRQDLQGYEISKFMKMAPDEVVAALNDPLNKAKYSKLFSQETRDKLTDLYAAISKTQQQGGREHVRVWGYHGGLGLATALMMGHLTGYTGTLAGITLSGVTAAKLMTNPRIARVLVNAADGAATGLSDTTISRMIIGALQGTGAQIGLINHEGIETKGTVGAEGAFVPNN